MTERVQWYGTSSTGVRSWALHGITKVHLVEPGAYATLCGRKLPRPSKRMPLPDAAYQGNDCRACAKKAEWA